MSDMATIRKRTLPSGRSAWLASYTDSGGARRFRQFPTKKEADGFLVRVRSEVLAGIHVPDRAASTVDDAYRLLIAALEADLAAGATLHNYRVYYKGHVKPYLGARLLPKIHPADVGDWLERLKAEGRTDDTCRRARIVLGVIFTLTQSDRSAVGGKCGARRFAKLRRRSGSLSARW
jgi:integrase